MHISVLRPLALVLLALSSQSAAFAQHGEEHAEGDLPMRGCGTHRAVMDLLNQGLRAGTTSGGQAASTAQITKTSVANLYGRTYVTANFALHYTLAPTVNRPRWVNEVASDPLLRARVDSLLASFPTLSVSLRDSTLHAKLDSMNSAHPHYVVKAGEHFERAWQYYDSLGMRMPDSSASLYFKNPIYGRVAVDIANIASVVSGYNGPYYGLAWPPSSGQGASILLENDFLYGTSVTFNPSTGQSIGPAIRAIYKGQTYRDYSVEWDLGLKVTASHEFYHIIQYQYTPISSGFHAWYELSATGMEERLAPEVNDYFQYLPFNVERNHDVSLFTALTTANYGNATFHIFMTKELGADFDVTLWEHLSDTNNLYKALVKTAGSQAAWDSLFKKYAAAMSISGTVGAAGSPLAFSPDMAQWPLPHFDTVPATGTQINMPALTYRLIRPPVTGAGMATLTGGLEGARRVDSSAAGYQMTSLPGTVFGLSKGAGVTRATYAVVNSPNTGVRSVLLVNQGGGFQLTRNPIKRNTGPLLILAPGGGAVDSLRIVSESGRTVAKVAADTSGTFWSWNLKDSQNRTVPVGLYHLRRAGEPGKSVLIIP